MFVGSQKHRDRVKAHRESTADPIQASSYRRPLVRLFAGIYTLYPTNELYIVSCFLAQLIVEGPLGPWGGSQFCLPVTMRLGSTNIRFVY